MPGRPPFRAGEPIRALRRAPGKDVRAALDRRVGIRRFALLIRVHAGAAAAIAACWTPAAGTPVPVITG